MTELDGKELSGRRRPRSSAVAGVAVAAVALAGGGSAVTALSSAPTRVPQPPSVSSSALSVEQHLVQVVNSGGVLVNQATVTHPNRALRGVQVGTTPSGGELIVAVAHSGGPAARAGILAGDVITAVNGTATPDPTALAGLLAGMGPRQPASVSLTHPDGTSQTVQVSLGTYHG
jgi:S1-C subfamily serine protease